MGDAMVIDVVKKSMKRKRVELVMSLEERVSRIGVLREEIDGLMKYYNEGFGGKQLIDVELAKGVSSSNVLIGCLLEESSLSLSKLVESIYGLVKEKDGGLTVAGVKSCVIGVGQRCCYGVQNPNADVLEDESGSCLWCWEV